MKTFRLVFTSEARDDLDAIYTWIADKSGERIAASVTRRLRTFCFGLTHAPERGRRRDDLKPGLRLLGYRRFATIAIAVSGDEVIILRIAYRGRDVEALFSDFES